MKSHSLVVRLGISSSCARFDGFYIKVGRVFVEDVLQVVFIVVLALFVPFRMIFSTMHFICDLMLILLLSECVLCM